MTDDEFETLWELEARERSRQGLPEYAALQAFAATHPQGIHPVKLRRRFEVEGFRRGDVQLAMQRATDWGYLRNGPGWEIFAGERPFGPEKAL